MVKKHPHRKVDKQPHDVVQGCNEWTSSQCWIDVIAVEDQRNQRAERSGKDDHCEQGDTYYKSKC